MGDWDRWTKHNTNSPHIRALCLVGTILAASVHVVCVWRLEIENCQWNWGGALAWRWEIWGGVHVLYETNSWHTSSVKFLCWTLHSLARCHVIRVWNSCRSEIEGCPWTVWRHIHGDRRSSGIHDTLCVFYGEYTHCFWKKINVLVRLLHFVRIIMEKNAVSYNHEDIP